MGLSVVSFVFAWFLGQGDTTAFLIVCLASGLALGADLALPSALLATTLPTHDATGAYFGWWNCVAKLNLALAAGLALPLLEWGGYTPGARTDAALLALSSAYCLLPCAIKLAALWALWRFAAFKPIKELS
jgi:Na+/melibiose symporter-like transporter